MNSVNEAVAFKEKSLSSAQFYTGIHSGKSFGLLSVFQVFEKKKKKFVLLDYIKLNRMHTHCLCLCFLTSPPWRKKLDSSMLTWHTAGNSTAACGTQTDNGKCTCIRCIHT